MVRLFFYIVLLINGIAIPIFANDGRTLTLAGNVYDATFRSQLAGAKMYLLDSMGTVIDSTKTGHTSTMVNGQWKSNSDYVFKVKAIPAQYVIEANYKGYEPEFITVNIDKVGNRENIKHVPDIFLRREFKEVTVTATKVKFYNKGDTLVYNADAFMLAEGSMLDALIQQLPGVEIKEDGRIFVNGKYVESLLLNGKQFLGNDNRLLLDNLGAYMVKDVAVYEKLGDKSRFMGRDTGDKEYVMDVRMKKEFMGSYVINTEVGYGTKDRYMGRLFIVRSDNSSQYILYGNINNLNDKLTPGQNNNWNSQNMQSGLHREKLAGGQYEISGNPGTKWNVKGNIIARHSAEDDDIFTDRTNFLPGGNTYNYLFNRTRNRNLSLSTFHSGNKEWEKIYLTGDIRGTFNRNNNRNDITSATFNNEQESVTRKWLENIYSTGSEASVSNLINRVMQFDSIRTNTWSVNASSIATYKFSQNNDDVTIWIKGGYTRETPERYNDQRLNFGNNPIPDRIFQIFKNHPRYEYYVKPIVNYSYYFNGGGYIQPEYTFSYTNRKRDSRLYEPTDFEPNLFYCNDMTLNVDNSYYSLSTEQRHTIGFRSSCTGRFNNGYWRIMLGPTLGFASQRLNFNQAKQYIIKHRNSVYYSDSWTELKFGFGAYKSEWGGRTYRNTLTLKFDANEVLPAMNYLIDIPNTSDPLTVLEGVPKLKNQQDYTWKLRYDLKPQNARIIESAELFYHLITNALVRGYNYDSTTGIQTIRSYNTSGNWESGVSNNLSLPLDKQRRITLSSITSAKYGHATDIIGKNETIPAPYTIRNFITSEKINLSWNAARWINLSGKAEIEYRNTTSTETEFNEINAITGNYGIIATLKFAKKLSIASDLTLYTRNGYNMPGLNHSDLVWNARVAYSLDKGRWNLMLDGFDLLHRLSSVRYSVNAQGRTVTYLNSLPRFLMFHVQYRIDIKPKKK